MLGGIGALGGAALGSGVGGFAETGDLETGILTGLGAFAGGALLGPLMGGSGGSAAGAAAGNPATAAPGGLGSLMSGPAPGSTASMLGTAAPSTGILRGAMDFAKSGVGSGVGIGGAVGSAMAPMISGSREDENPYSGMASTEMKPIPRDVQMPGSGYQPGVSSEFNYGFDVPTSADVLSYRDTNVNPFKMAGGGMIRSLQESFGPIRLAEGGIAALLDEESEDDEEGEDEVSSGVGGGGNEKDIVVEAVRAIKGQSQSPEIALGRFLAKYGEDALRDLVDRVQSGDMDETVSRSEGKMRGPGDGMDDLIPANIDGEQDVLLSDGEFVVPADVVSGLGNGSSDAGARALEEMMDRVRQARNGSTEQPPQVPKEEMLPV